MSEAIFSIREEEELFEGEFLYLETLVILLVINKKTEINEPSIYTPINTTDVF